MLKQANSTKTNKLPTLAKVNRLIDNTIEVEVTIPKSDLKKEYDQVLSDLQKTTEIKGFRKGKAPKDRVEKTVGQNDIYQRVIDQILPKTYQKTIQDQNLKPIISPKVELVSAKADQDWKVKFTTCELPEIDLNNYKEEIKKIITKEVIWTPKKDQPKKTKKPVDKSLEKAENFQKIIDTLAKTIKVKLPKVLIENETNQKLARLIEKTEKMGLALEQYLSTIGKTIDLVKKEYQQESEKNWQLELALNKIADEEKIVVSDQDIELALAKIEDKQEKKQLSNQRYMFSSMIRRQKTLEFLQNL